MSSTLCAKPPLVFMVPAKEFNLATSSYIVNTFNGNRFLVTKTEVWLYSKYLKHKRQV